MGFLKNRTNGIIYTINKDFNSDMCIAVQNGQVVVNAPWYISNKKIQKIINEKRNWILNKIKEYDCSNDETIYSKPLKILGKNYVVNIEYYNINSPELNLDKGIVNIKLPLKYMEQNKEKIVNILIEKMYLKMAEKYIENCMEKMRIKLNICPEDYEIRKMKNTFGRCDSNKKIYINPEIMQFSKDEIEYIVLHQFCHLKYKIHSKGFIAMMESNCKNYIDLEEKLENVNY